MKSLLLVLTILTISSSQIHSAENLISNTSVEAFEINVSQPLFSFIKSTDRILDNKSSDVLLSRRKGEIKYRDLKVYWKKFIENLDNKRQNPDQVVLDNKKSLA